jgi:hypothetical protein
MNARIWAAVVVCISAAVMGSGCQLPSKPAAPTRAPVERDPLDPVAERMHELSGQILLFHSAYKRLPKSLQELCQAVGEDTRAALDPATGRPVAYDPAGFANISGAGRVIAYASPSGPGDSCWCISFTEAGGAAVCRVVPLPASDLLSTNRTKPPK